MPSNFGEIVAGDRTFAGVYRGGQPRSCGEIQYLRQLGVKTIVKLNERGTQTDAAERRTAEAAGIHVEAFDLSARSIGTGKTCDDVKRILNFIASESNRPTYVHCSIGRDRTGYIAGAYEEAILHKSVKEVLAELARHGHRGLLTLLFPQIRRELRTGMPQCVAPR
jgi:protein tyrosine/serine phosphatase